MFDREDQYLGNDGVFGVKESLIADFKRHEPGRGPEGRTLKEPWFSLEYDFALGPRGQPEERR